ncbi:MAG: LysR family transcriptional regulator [Clostridium sp.]
MNSDQLRYVVEIAEKGSINKAAESLFISQPNLSNIIKDLENEINIKIFNRNNRGITLTKEVTNCYK